MTPTAYLLQRGTAMIMVPLVLTHLAVIVMAVQGGLTAEEILGRTRGNMAWAAFYGLFVLSAAVHAGIGLQTIAREWFALSNRTAAVTGHLFMVLLMGLGLRAVIGVYGL